jgi:RNA polymerase sigma-70 factor (ECF subfamily)
MVVAIEARMSAQLRARCSPEDIWQETLLHAWRDRASCEWQGVRAFRRWLLQIAEHRVQNLADREHALKRGGAPLPLERVSPAGASEEGAPSTFAGPVATTTPSRAASDAEQARRMRRALDALPEELRVVVQLRLFDELTFEEAATRIGITVSGVRHRFRRGFELYHRALAELRGTAGA